MGWFCIRIRLLDTTARKTVVHHRHRHHSTRTCNRLAKEFRLQMFSMMYSSPVLHFLQLVADLFCTVFCNRACCMSVYSVCSCCRHRPKRSELKHMWNESESAQTKTTSNTPHMFEAVDLLQWILCLRSFDPSIRCVQCELCRPKIRSTFSADLCRRYFIFIRYSFSLTSKWFTNIW